MSKDIFPILGMSPGNSYFKEAEIRFLLESVVQKFGRVAVFIPDVPAIATYMAFGYPENRARKDKAIPQGNLLRNRVQRAMTQLGYTDEEVRVISWSDEVENSPSYQKIFEQVRGLYENNKDFMEAADATTRQVLESSKRKLEDTEVATKVAVHYLLSEIAFLEFAADFLGADKTTYVYHKNWPVFEDYVAGKFDGEIKKHMDFWLLENPWETYNPIWGLEDEEETDKYKNTLDRVEKTGILRVAFSDYPPAFTHDEEYDNFSGIFYEIIIAIARKHDWQIRWSEETGYGVVVSGLNNERFDVFGSPVWPIPERQKNANPSDSLYKSDVFIWVREDFNTNQKLDDRVMRVGVKENDISDYLAETHFPSARKIFTPQLETVADLLQFIVDDKADFTFTERAIVDIFNRTAEKKLVEYSEEPITTFENTFLFKNEDDSLRDLFNQEIQTLKTDGTLERLVQKYSGGKEYFKI